MAVKTEGKLDASGLRFALVVSRFNDSITRRLLGGAEECLTRHGADASQLSTVWVPGSFELHQAVARLTRSGKFDAVIALGCLIRGETPHFDVLASTVATRLAVLAESSGVPVTFGVLTTDTVDQALNRAGGKAGNKGWDAALSAIEMADLFRQLA